MTTKITTTPTPLAVVDKINSIIDDATSLSTTVGNKLDKTGTAAKATADANGKNIANTYATKAQAVTSLSASGKTVTYTKADGSTGTFTTQDTNTTYTAMTASEATTGTATTARSITAKVLHDKINEMVVAKAPHTGNATSIGGASATKPAVVVTTYRSGTSWYRVWSDGWLEQGGIINAGRTVTFLKPFPDTNYTLCTSIKSTSSTYNINWLNGTPQSKSATGFSSSGSGAGFEWTAYGTGGGA